MQEVPLEPEGHLQTLHYTALQALTFHAMNV